MRTTILAVFAFVPLLATAAAAPLFTHSGKFDVVGGESTLVKVEEVSRAATSSVVRVTGSAPVSGLHNRFLGLAMCSLAKARSQSYFQVRRVAGDPETFEVVFPIAGLAQTPSGSFPDNATAPNIYPVSACP